MRALCTEVLSLILIAGAWSDTAAGTLFRRAARDDLPRTGKSFGATWVDLDRDGRLDLLLLRHGEGVGVYLVRDGLGFARRDSCRFLPCVGIDQHGTAVCDYDHDGAADLYAVVGADRGRRPGRNELWSPGPDGRYRDILGDRSVLADSTGRGRGAVWCELDGDAHPELLVLNYESRHRLFSFDGEHWRDRAGSFRPAPPGSDRGPAWFGQVVAADFDGDRLTDLFLSGSLRRLYRNEASGRLVDATEPSGLAGDGPALAQSAAGDLDGDGDLDLLLAERRPGALQVWLNESVPGAPRFKGGGTLDHLPLAYEIDVVQLADFDNDGHLDLYASMHYRDGFNLPNLVARGLGDGSFADAGEAWGGLGDVEALPCGVWPVDLDRDGDLDLVLLHGKEDFPARDGIVVVYENTTTRPGLTMVLEDPHGPPHGLGARVELHTAGGVQVRQVRATMSYWSSVFLPLHFGLGEDPGPCRAVITWPDGSVQEVELPHGRRAWSVTRGDAAPRALGGG